MTQQQQQQAQQPQQPQLHPHQQHLQIQQIQHQQQQQPHQLQQLQQPTPMVLNTMDGPPTGGLQMQMSDQVGLLAAVKAEPIQDNTSAAASTSNGSHLVYAVKRQRVEGWVKVF